MKVYNLLVYFPYKRSTVLVISEKKKRDFTEGPIFVKMILFTLPLMAASVLQVFYNMADNIVVGKFSGDPNALAAVSSTSAITTLVVNLLIGISTGAGVLVAQGIGARREEHISRIVHTSMLFAIIGGVVLSLIAFAIAPSALNLLGVKSEIIAKSTMYMRIISIGIPAVTIYNFGASILRSAGDSKSSLYILAISGIANVALNLVFVISFNMSIAGVAVATVISQYISAVWVVGILLYRKDECYSIKPAKLKIHGDVLLQVLRIGIPGSLQTAMFSISNVVISSAINSLPLSSINANSVSGNIDNITSTAVSSYMHASITYVGQNFGARNYDRVKKAICYTLLQSIATGIILGGIELIFLKQLTMLFVDISNPQKNAIVKEAIEISRLVLGTIPIFCIMQTLSGSIKGLGYSLTPAITALVGCCGFRLIWIAIFFSTDSLSTLFHLQLCYPISYALTALGHLTALLIIMKKKGIIGTLKQQNTAHPPSS